MNNWTSTDEWSRYENEAPSCGATLRVFRDEDKFLVVRADVWTGGFDQEGLISCHDSLEQAVKAMHEESSSC